MRISQRHFGAFGRSGQNRDNWGMTHVDLDFSGEGRLEELDAIIADPSFHDPLAPKNNEEDVNPISAGLDSIGSMLDHPSFNTENLAGMASDADVPVEPGRTPSAIEATPSVFDPLSPKAKVLVAAHILLAGYVANTPTQVQS